MVDPDAPSGTFRHWIGWNITGPAWTLRAGKRAPVEGRNSAGGVGYIGPRPPAGTHRYVFRLYALRTPLQLPAGSSRTAFERALKGKTLAVARLVGR